MPGRCLWRLFMCMGGILASGAIQTSRGGRLAPFWKVVLFYLCYFQRRYPTSRTVSIVPSRLFRGNYRKKQLYLSFVSREGIETRGGRAPIKMDFLGALDGDFGAFSALGGAFSAFGALNGVFGALNGAFRALNGAFRALNGALTFLAF